MFGKIRSLTASAMMGIGGILLSTAQVSAAPTFSMSIQPSDPVFTVGQETELNIVLGNNDDKVVTALQLSLNVGTDYKLSGLSLGSDLAGTSYAVQPADYTMLPENGTINLALMTMDILHPQPISGNIITIKFECTANDPDESFITFVPGSFVITGTLMDGDYLKQPDVTLDIEDEITDPTIIYPAESIKITNTPAGNEILVGEEWTFNLEVTPSDATLTGLTWTVTPDNIVNYTTDPQTGSITVTGVESGSVTLTANLPDPSTSGTHTDSYTFEVINVKAESVSLSAASLEMKPGDTEKLTATVTPADAVYESLSWSSSDTSVCTVSEDGTVTAISAGTATVTVSVVDSSLPAPVTASCTVTVGNPTADSITLSPTSLELKEGETGRLTATVTPQDAVTTLTWSSSDNAVATVSESGLVTAVAEGEATVTVATAEGLKAVADVVVSKNIIEVTAVSLTPGSAEIKVGETVTLSATVTPGDATDRTVTWTTSDASVATVANGFVTGVKEGNVTITATASSGVSAEAAIVVKANVIEVETIVVTPSTAEVKEGETVTLTATVTPEDATDKTVTWTTSDAGVATVENGVVTGVKKGSATITAVSSNGKKAVAEISVIAAINPDEGDGDDDDPNNPGGGDGGDDDPNNPGGGDSGDDDPNNPGGGTGGDDDPNNPGGGDGGDDDPNNPGGGTGGDDDPNNPGGGTGGDDDPNNPGGGDGGDDDPNNPGGGDGGDDDPNNPGGGDGGDDPNNPGGGTGGDDDPSNPGGGNGGDDDPNNPGGGNGGDDDPNNPGGGNGGEDDPNNPGGGNGGDDDPNNPGGGDSGDDDPNNPGGGTGGDDDPNNPGGGTGGDDDPNNPGGGNGGDDDPNNPGGGTGGDDDPNHPGGNPGGDNPDIDDPNNPWPDYPNMEQSVTLNFSDIKLYIGQIVKLCFDLNDIEGEPSDIQWKSNNVDIAIVDSDGVLRAVGVGECTVYVTMMINDKIYGAYCKVTVWPLNYGAVDSLEDEEVYTDIFDMNGNIVALKADSEKLKQLAPGVYILRQGDSIRKTVIR